MALKSNVSVPENLSSRIIVLHFKVDRKGKKLKDKKNGMGIYILYVYGSG